MFHVRGAVRSRSSGGVERQVVGPFVVRQMVGSSKIIDDSLARLAVSCSLKRTTSEVQ